MKKISFLFFITIILLSCSSEDDSADNGQSNNFDRAAMLTNIADNIVIPALNDLDSKLGQLQIDLADFSANTNQTTLIELRTSWLEAYKSWQYVEMFDIGRAEEIKYAFQMNTYPTSLDDINNNINSIDESRNDLRSYDLTSDNNNDAVGFPAVEYMLYGIESDDNAIIAAYTSDGKARKNLIYLTDLINQMVNNTNTVRNDWLNSYRDQFVNSTDNNGSSAINQLANDFIFYYERKLRANKIGIPAGVFSRNPLPELVEGFYSKIYSKELALESLQASTDFFNGVTYNTNVDGLGYADYTMASTDLDLVSMINAQLELAKSQMTTLNNDLSLQVATDNSQMTRTYDELQRVVVLLKVDMLQILDIPVDFMDADGD